MEELKHFYRFITRVFNYTLCVNANSPITLTPREYTGNIQNISTINYPSTVYRGNNTGNLTECSMILNELDATVPVQGRQVPGGRGGSPPRFLKEPKIGGAAPQFLFKNDAHFKGILILVNSMCCK